MKLALVLISSFCLAGAIPGGTAFAQTPEAARREPLAPPRGGFTDAYDRAVVGDGLQKDLLYLPPGMPLDAEIQREPENPREVARGGSASPAMNATAWSVLAVLGLGLAFLAIRYRRFLRALFTDGDRALDVGTALAGGQGAGERLIDHDLLARLLAEEDPRIGLRLLLKRFLALAASENRIVLSRSLTTRELLASTPGNWRHRGDLERLASRVELTVFGGREMNREAYRECIDLAAPLLFRVERA